MNNVTAIHHHFEFSHGILENTGYSKNVTFQNIPLFQLFPLDSLSNIRRIVDSMHKKMPPKYRKLFHKFNPPDHIQNSNYRQEHISLTYCKFNNQSFFLRCYQLKQNHFLKVEITFFAESIGSGKYLELNKVINNAEKVFNYIGQYTFPVSLFKHMDDYFFLQSFDRYVSAFEEELFCLKNHRNDTLKKSLKRDFVKRLFIFQKKSKEIAEQRLKDIKYEYEITQLSKNNLL